MDPRRPPTALSPSPSHHHRQLSRPTAYDTTLHTSTLSEKDAAQTCQDVHVAPPKGRRYDSGSHPFAPRQSTPSPVSSISLSAAHDTREQHIEAASPVPIAYPPAVYTDPEKQALSPFSPRSHPDVTAIVYDSGEYNEKEPEEKAVQILLFLSGPCALLSLAVSFWTIVAILLATLIAPIHFFTKGAGFTDQLKMFLAPPLNLHLRLIYSSHTATNYSAPMLVVVDLLSPFVAMGAAIAVWIAAFFWFFSAILGDPAGQDGHNDGKETILGVRNWWERWLSRALR